MIPLISVRTFPVTRKENTQTDGIDRGIGGDSIGLKCLKLGGLICNVLPVR